MIQAITGFMLPVAYKLVALVYMLRLRHVAWRLIYHISSLGLSDILRDVAKCGYKYTCMHLSLGT
jgi:hypothetical protein